MGREADSAENDVAAVAERELGAAPECVDRLTDGLIHDTYALHCDGESYVLQFVAEADDREDSLSRGIEWYRRLADSAVPVPRVVTDGLGEYAGRRYAVVERLPGASAELDVSPARVRNAGRYLARIHRLEGFEDAGWIRFVDGEVTVEPYPETRYGERLRRLGRERAGTLREGGLEAAADAVEGVLDRLPAAIPGEFDPVLCHGDFSPDNVIYREEERRRDEVVGIIDFDRAYAGHAHRDLAHGANAFWMHDPATDWDVRATLYEGYRRERAPGADFDRLEPLYRVETLARGIAGMVERDLLSEYERAFYDERIVEAVERVGSSGDGDGGSAA